MSQSAILKELKKRATASSGPKKEFKLEDFCFDKQLAFIQDPSRFKVAVSSRRAGKTVSCAADLIHTANSLPGDVAYITLNRRSAKKIIWRDLLKINKEYGLGAKPDNTELTLTMPNGSVIHISGAKDEQEAEKFRGLALRKIYIDETQSFRSYLEGMIEDVLVPSLTDYNGSLVLIGTPGPVPAGFFYNISGGNKELSKGWSAHHWTMQDNPHILLKSGVDPLKAIEEIAKQRGVGLEDPRIQREYFGRWIQDSDSLVFKFNPSKNIYLEELPKDLIYVVGADIGYVDADAISVLGYSPQEQKVYCVEEYIQDKSPITPFMLKLKYFKEKYQPIKMVMDAGGLGKKIQEELLQRHGIFIEAAEKVRKTEFIALLNDDLTSGKMQFKPESRFEADSYLLQWDYSNPARAVIDSRYHSDVCFVANTPVLTGRGWLPIQQVEAQDTIYTRAGYFPVEWAGRTSKSESLVKLIFSNGATLTCTPSHPIYTHNRGFIAADQLTPEDRCSNIPLWESLVKTKTIEKQSFLTKLRFTDTRNHLEHIFETILAGFIKTKKSCFTGLFGSSIMAQFHQPILCTTKTKIHLITALKIFSAFLLNSTLANTNIRCLRKLLGSIWTKYALRQQSGIKVQPAKNGIKNTPLNLPLDSTKKSRLCAQFAQSPTLRQLSLLLSRFAQIPAILKSGGFLKKTMKLGSVIGARPNLAATNTLNKDSVVGLVTREILTQKEPVYNIKVNGPLHEYYANGILVHNCDSVLYAWRECKHFYERDVKPAPLAPDPYMAALEAKEAEEMENRLRNNGNFTDVNTWEDLGITDGSIFDE